MNSYMEEKLGEKLDWYRLQTIYELALDAGVDFQIEYSSCEGNWWAEIRSMAKTENLFLKKQLFPLMLDRIEDHLRSILPKP